MEGSNEFLTSAQAAKELGISVREVHYLCSVGLLRGSFQEHKRGPWQIPADAVNKLRTSSGDNEIQISGRRSLIYNAYRRYKAPTLAIITALITLIGLAANLRDFGFFIPKERMAGDFKIAVAQFEMVGNRETATFDYDLAQTISLNLEDEIAEQSINLIITIWGPDKVGVINGRDSEERARAAENVANTIGADIVVYGLVEASESSWKFTPEFFISDHNLVDALEISGPHQVGSPIEIMGQMDIVNRIHANSQLGTRTQLITLITVGLVYYKTSNYFEALTVFQRIENEFDFADTGGKELVFLLLGNAAGKGGDYELAENAYQSAIQENPEYSRAYIGMGSVFYSRAITSFPLNPIEFHKALDYYDLALAASYQPPLADIEPKVHFGRGQALLGLAFLGEPLEEAVEEFLIVIASYEEGSNPRLKELASESHGRLGLIYRKVGNQQSDTDLLRLALAHYENAAELANKTSGRKEVFEQRIADLELLTEQTSP